jgi:UMF1 family MFS transporter
MSGWAWGFGYAGGLAALVVALFGFVRTDGAWFGVGTEAAANVRAVAPLAAAWFALFALPLFLFTPDAPPTGISLSAATRAGLAQLARTARKVRGFRHLVVFLLAMMCALNRPHELRIHLRGAIKNGCTQDEIREVLLQVAIYCGIPASLDAHNMAVEIFGEDSGTPAKANY